MLTSDPSCLMWLLWGFAAAGVVFLVLVLQFLTYSSAGMAAGPVLRSPKPHLGALFSRGSHCKVGFSE